MVRESDTLTFRLRSNYCRHTRTVCTWNLLHVTVWVLTF